MQEVLPCIYSKNHPNSIMYYTMSVDRLLKKLPVWKNAVPTYWSSISVIRLHLVSAHRTKSSMIWVNSFPTVKDTLLLRDFSLHGRQSCSTPRSKSCRMSQSMIFIPEMVSANWSTCVCQLFLTTEMKSWFRHQTILCGLPVPHLPAAKPFIISAMNSLTGIRTSKICAVRSQTVPKLL